MTTLIQLECKRDTANNQYYYSLRAEGDNYKKIQASNEGIKKIRSLWYKGFITNATYQKVRSDLAKLLNTLYVQHSKNIAERKRLSIIANDASQELIRFNATTGKNDKEQQVKAMLATFTEEDRKLLKEFKDLL